MHTLSYTYIGRVKAHSSRITGMDFGYRDGVEVEILLNPFYYFINAW